MKTSSMKMLLVALVSVRRACFGAQLLRVCGKTCCDGSIRRPDCDPGPARISVTVKCHPAHRFSRRERRQRYRNLIKARPNRTGQDQNRWRGPGPDGSEAPPRVRL
jgi:hypothetical protein